MTSGYSLGQQRQAFDVLCPMHVEMDDQGVIRHVGPTMEKLRPGLLVGQPFWRQFELIRPKKILDIQHVQDIAG
ncbi:MAG: hypothetical protein AAF386_04500, partial [Pseudomonadota bacterium]